MRRFALIAVVFSLFALPSAKAQSASIYVTAAPVYLTHLYTVTGTTTPGAVYSGDWFFTGNAGFTLNFAPSGPVTFGLDFRGGPKVGTPGLGFALLGLRLGFPQTHHLKPYGQLSIGYLDQSHRTGSGTAEVVNSQSYVGVEFLGGMDYPVTRHIDIRVIEVGLGVTKYAAAAGSNTSPNPSIVSLQSGLVYHF